MVDRALDTAGAEIVSELTDFTFALRVAGLAVTIEHTMRFLRAVAELPSLDQVQIFWAGRAALCCEPADFDIYDETFDWFFRQPVPLQGRSGDRRPAAGAQVEPLARLASDVESQLHQELSEADRNELAGLLRLLAPTPPIRRRARRAPARPGRGEPGRTLRAVWRPVGLRPRKLVLLIDVSSSMTPYSESLLRFAHSAKRRFGNGCEVFALGAGLSRLTAALADRDPGRALHTAGTMIPALSGQARLGQALQAFLDQYGQRGMAQGAVVIVFSDGCERGSVDLLAEQARQLRRLTRSLIWIDPGQHDGATPSAGLAAVQPCCDHLLTGHSLATIRELMDLVRDA